MRIRKIVQRLLATSMTIAGTAGAFVAPTEARFISPDDLSPTISAVGTNRYAYALNDPINKSDPNGHLAYDSKTEKFTTTEGDTFDSVAKQTGADKKELKSLNEHLYDKKKDKWDMTIGSPINIPDSKNVSAFREAVRNLSSTSYAYAVRNGFFLPGTNKCNLFVRDVYVNSIGSFPASQTSRANSALGWLGWEPIPVTARALATKDFSGWVRSSGPNAVSQARIGDVISWDMNFADATGHTAIFTGSVQIDNNRPQNGSTFGTIGAGEYFVNYRDQQYLEERNYINPSIQSTR